MKIIGYKYVVKDNSYILNIETQRKAYLNQDIDCCNEEEKGAEFRIVSNPYKNHVEDILYPYDFINVQSNKTFNVYRVLFNPSWVVTTKYNYNISFIGITSSRPDLILDLHKFLKTKGIEAINICVSSEVIK